MNLREDPIWDHVCPVDIDEALDRPAPSLQWMLPAALAGIAILAAVAWLLLHLIW
ncbi:MAG: hypothetical protein JWO65_283 [Sphingomonas bacterium]|jgi:hypothetical protein|nr:hypothetical protein [Sphingomonas bacterium]